MSIEQRLEQLAFGMGQRFAALRERARETVDAAIADLKAKQLGLQLDVANAIATIRNGEPGRDGDKGDPGPPGKDGKDGQDGKSERGEPGEKGEKGEQGEAGIGEKGERGEQGERGTFAAPSPWHEGVHYQGALTFLDGSTWCARRDTAARPPHEDWAPVATAGIDGRTGDARGLYEPEAAYLKLDRVAFNGSEWISRQDDPGPLPGEGWMLAARAGTKGKDGERGPAGPRGEKGEAGIGIAEIAIRDFSIVLDLTDGRTSRIDLRGMFERYHQERGG